MRQPVISTSFVQDQRHATKTETFQAIQPSQIATILDSYGFDLISLKTGRAKNPDRADHQTTIARYRSRDGFGINGSHFDLVFKIPHLYGALKGMLGMFRLVCSNGLVVGQMFERISVRHVGSPMEELNSLIPRLVAQRQLLVDQVQAMQARNVTPQELADLSRAVAGLRLQGIDAKNVQYSDLLKVRRSEDGGSDLFSVLNVLQENVMRFGIRYQTESVDAQTNAINVRNMVARPVSRNRAGETETVRSVDLNASIWDEAAKLLKAG